MGNVQDCAEPVVKHGLLKTHITGGHIVVSPVANYSGDLAQPMATVLVLHDDNECPQTYLEKAWNNKKDTWMPWTKTLCKVILVQAPSRQGEGKYRWDAESELMVSNLMSQEVQLLAGQSHRLFVGGFGKGAHVALNVAMKSSIVLGGVFTRKALIPADLLSQLASSEA